MAHFVRSLAALLLGACLVLADGTHAAARGTRLSKAERAVLDKALSEKRFGDLRKELRLLALKVARRPKAAQEAFAALRADYLAKRTAWLRAAVAERFLPVARELITARARDKKSTASASLTWVRSQLGEHVARRIADALKASEKLTTAAVLEAWKQRKRGAWRTFEFPTGGQSQIVATRQLWWSTARENQRVDRLFQALLLDTKLLDLGKRNPKVPCKACRGTGVEEYFVRRGKEHTRTCRRCGGTAHAPATRYR